MKVTVRVVSGYGKYNKEELITMFEDQDCELEELRSEMQLLQDLHEQEIDVLLDKLNEAAEEARKWQKQAKKLEAVLRKEEEKRKFFAVLTKARDEGWLSLFVPNMTPEQRAWLDEWKEDGQEKVTVFLSEKADGARQVGRKCCYRILKFLDSSEDK